MLSTSLTGIQPESVLVIYNSEEADSLAVHDYYVAARPGVRSFDLNDGTLSAGTISYANFISKIRNPIRTYLNGNSLEETVEVLVLTKGLPHRVQDLDPSAPNLGDSPNAAEAAYEEGDLTYASVDSELTLLQFDLEAGEAGGSMDSVADRAVYNPYFRETTAFSSFDRNRIADPDRDFFQNETVYGWWRGYTMRRRVIFLQKEEPFDAGHLYLTSRLDADTVEDVKSMIDRAASIFIRRQTDALLFDADARGTPFQVYEEPISGAAINDYAEATARFTASWDRLRFDETGAFLVGATDTVSFSPLIETTGPVAHLNSYGVNHSGGGERNYLASYAGQLVPGASFSAYESYGASGLGDVSPPINQAQVTEWIAAGGTFATGPVWEPFTFGISKSDPFLKAFFDEGLTFVEAAWSSIPQLSWQSVVIGDPLATATIIDAEPYFQWSLGTMGTTPTVDETASESEDFESDDISNGVEYGLDLDPAVSSAGSERLLRVTKPGLVVFQIPSPAPVGVGYAVERSPDLSLNSWDIIATRNISGEWTGSATVTEDSITGGLQVTVTESEPLPVGDAHFYRLVVSF